MATTTQNSSSKMIITILIILAVIAGAYLFLNGRDNRTSGERVGDAVDSFSETGSLDRAGEQLNDQTPAERVGNSIQDATE